jgi:sphingolipid 4-desaturase/C4-monooxygenase
MARFTDFSYSTDSEPHRKNTKTILKNHPEMRTLIGRNPWTAAIILGVVALQIGVTIFVSSEAWWVVFVAAYVIGAFASHTLFVCIHEAAHNLIFANRTLNTIFGIIANLTQVFPSSVSFQKYHLKHHAFQGVMELDADLPYHWEARLANNSTIGKAIWLLFYPIFQLLRPSRIKEVNFFDGWILANWFFNFAFVGTMWYFLGPKSFVYMTASLFFSIGLHPLGARWIQEHYLTSGSQETHSYYGPLNVVNLNVGYHNEHHDFPSVPWNRLPKIRAIGREHYDSLAYHLSYTKLLFKFLLDKNLSVFSRMLRQDRGKVGLNQPVKPDVEILSGVTE